MADTIDPTMQKMLLDFNKTITENPKISDADLYNKYPELGNDEKLLGAAYDYSATLNSPKYKSPEEFNDKFPEFALKKKGQTEPSTSSSEQTKPVSTSGLPNQKEVSQSGGEKQPSDWSKRYVDKLKEYDKKNPVNALALTEEQKKNVFIEKPGAGSTVLPTTLEDVTKARDILLKNKDKNFVKRALNPTDYPSIKLPDGDNATHKMAYAEVDGKYIVYPTIIQDDKGDLKELDGDKAIDHALKNGEYISFDNEKDAGWFSENYKSIWKEAEQKDKIDKKNAIENFDFFSLAKEQPSEQGQGLGGDIEAVKYSQASLNDAQQSRDKLAMEEIVLTPSVSDLTISANSLNLVNSLGVNPQAGYSKILEERISLMQQENPGLYNYTKEKIENPTGLTETQKFNMISKGLSDKMAEVNTNLDRANAKGYKDVYDELSSFISEKGDKITEQDKAYIDGYYQQNKTAIDTYEALLKEAQSVSNAYSDLLADFPDAAKRIKEQKEVNKALKDKVMTLNEPVMYVDDNGDVKWTMAGAASTMAINKITDALVDIGTFGAKLRNMGEAYAGTANSYSEADMLVDKFTDVVDNKLKLIEDANGLYDEDGKLNKSKIAKTIASATMDMGILMAGASKGTAVAKALGASEKVAANTALFSASFMQQYPDIEKDLMDRGVSPEDAVKVAMGMTTALSLMELINPNPDIMATINKGAFTKALTEGAVKEIVKGGENLGSRIIRKTIDYTADVTGENVQELSSLITEKLGNAAANNMLESQLTSKLETNISDKEIMETILATTGATLALKSLSKGGNDYIDNLLTASKRPEAFASVMNALLERGEVTPAEALSVTKTLEQIQLANAKIPEDLNPSVKNKVIPLVLEKTKLEEKKANTDAAFHEDIDAKISGVNEQIKSVINEKQTTDELQRKRQGEGQGEGEITQTEPEQGEEPSKMEASPVAEVKTEEMAEVELPADVDDKIKKHAEKNLISIEVEKLTPEEKQTVIDEIDGVERPFKFDTGMKKQGRFRLVPPENFESIKTATETNTVAEDIGLTLPKEKGVSFTVGIEKQTKKPRVQSVRFDETWTEERAAKWFNDNRKQFTFNAKKPTMTEMKSKQDYQKELEQQSFERVSKSVKAIGQYMIGKKKTEIGEPIKIVDAIKDVAKEAYYLGALNVAQYTDKIKQIIKDQSGIKVSNTDIDMVLSENDDVLLEEYSKLKKEGRPNIEKVVAEYEEDKIKNAARVTNKKRELFGSKIVAKEFIDDLKNRITKDTLSDKEAEEFERAIVNIENAGTQQQIDNAVNAIKNKFDYTGEYNTLVSKAKKEQSDVKKRYNKGEFDGNKDVKAVIKKILNIDFDKIKKAGYNLSNDFIAMFNEKIGDVTEGKVVDVAPLSELMDKYESAIDIAQNRNIVTEYDNIKSIDEAIEKLEKLKLSMDRVASGEEVSIDELRSMMRQARSLENKAKRLLSVGLLHMSEGKIIDATTKLNELVEYINSGSIAAFTENIKEKEQEYVLDKMPEVAENIYSVDENMQGDGGGVFDRFQKEQIKMFKDYIRKAFLMGDNFIAESFTADRLGVLNDIAEQLKLGLVTTQMYSEMEKIGSDMLKVDIRDNVVPLVNRWQLNLEEYVKKLNSKDTISWDMAFKMGLKGGEVLDKFFLGYAKSASANFVNNLAIAKHDVDKSVAKLYNAFNRRIKYGFNIAANAEVQMRMIGILKAQLDYISNIKENFSVVETEGEFKIYSQEGDLISTVPVENYGKDNYTEQDYINALKKVDQEKTTLADKMLTSPDMADRMYRLLYGDKRESFKSAKLSESVVKNNAKLLADRIAYDQLTGNTLSKGKDNGKRLTVKAVEQAKQKLNNLQKDVFDALTNFINENQGMIEQISQREGVPFVRRENYWPAYVSESTADYVDNSKSIEQAFNPADMKPAIKTKSINARTGVLKYTDNNAYKMFERYANKLYMDYYLAPEYTRESQALTKLSKEYRADDTTKNQFVFPEALKAAITNQWKLQVNGRPVLSKRERAISLGGISFLDVQSFIRKALRISSMRQLLSVVRPIREVAVWPIKMAGYTDGFNNAAMNPLLRGVKKKFSTFRDEYLTGAYASMKAAERKTSGDILNADTSVPMALEAFAKRNIINSGDYLTGNITFMNEFMNGFKKETGEKFDIDKALNDEEYRNKHLLDFERATNYANRQIEFIYVPQTSFGQAFSAWPFGEQKTFFNTIMRMLSTFQIRESLNFWEDGYRMMVNGDKESAIRFAKSVPAMATANYMYWALGQFAVAATRYMASDDEEEKEKIKERVEGMFTPEGVAKGYTQAAVGLITGAYGGISKIALWAGYSFYRNIYAGADAKAQLREDLGRDGKPKKTVKELDAEWRAIDDQVRGMLNVTPLMLTGYTDAEKQIENIASNLFPVFGSLVVDIKNSGKDIADLVAKGANEELQGDDLALYEVLSIGAMLASFVVANPASKETNAIINQLRREAEKDLKNMEESSKKRNKTKTTRFSNTGSSNTGGSNQSSSNNRRSNN